MNYLDWDRVVLGAFDHVGEVVVVGKVGVAEVEFDLFANLVGVIRFLELLIAGFDVVLARSTPIASTTSAVVVIVVALVASLLLRVAVALRLGRVCCLAGCWDIGLLLCVAVRLLRIYGLVGCGVGLLIRGAILLGGLLRSFCMEESVRVLLDKAEVFEPESLVVCSGAEAGWTSTSAMIAKAVDDREILCKNAIPGGF